MTGDPNPFLIDADALKARLAFPNTVVIDASWYLPQQERDGRAEYQAGHIPGAIYFDIDEMADSASGLPHMLLNPAEFGRRVGEMGVSDQATIVVYDGMGLFSAPRVWWNFRIMGATNVFLLDGGLPAWLAAGYPLETTPVTRPSAIFTPAFDATRVLDIDDVRAVVESGGSGIIDARGTGRFKGIEPEPRPGLRSGHMPGSKNLPFDQLLDNGRLRPATELKRLFEDAGIDLSRPLATTCGSGVTAAVLTLALLSIGHTDNALYDGSWSEWGGADDVEVVSGAD